MNLNELKTWVFDVNTMAEDHSNQLMNVQAQLEIQRDANASANQMANRQQQIQYLQQQQVGENLTHDSSESLLSTGNKGGVNMLSPHPQITIETDSPRQPVMSNRIYLERPFVTDPT